MATIVGRIQFSTAATVDVPWREIFPAFGTMFKFRQREVPLLLVLANLLPKTTRNPKEILE